VAGPPPASWAVRPQDAGVRLVAPGLWRLRLPTPWDGISHVNAYLIDRGDGSTVLVDCGTGGDPTAAAALEVAIDETGHRIEDVAVLAVTHVHSDHVGLAAHVLARSDAELWTHPDDQHFYEAFHAPDAVIAARERRARREGVPTARLEPYRTVREEIEGAQAVTAPDRPLHRDTVIDTALGPWRVLETPGHCPSHVCFVQPDHGLALVGDLICPVFVPWLDYGCSPDPYAEILASLDALEAAGPIAAALPGHGRPITDLGAVLADTRAGFAARMAATRRALAAGPGDGYTLTLRIFGDEDDLAAVGHLTEVLAYLRHLRLRGEVVRETTPDDTYLYRATGALP
jgi:glyoxylase-like metal-dependent hydrolase (beta-lactamase superfamily II)